MSYHDLGVNQDRPSSRLQHDVIDDKQDLNEDNPKTSLENVGKHTKSCHKTPAGVGTVKQQIKDYRALDLRAGISGNYNISVVDDSGVFSSVLEDSTHLNGTSKLDYSKEPQQSKPIDRPQASSRLQATGWENSFFNNVVPTMTNSGFDTMTSTNRLKDANFSYHQLYSATPRRIANADQAEIKQQPIAPSRCNVLHPTTLNPIDTPRRNQPGNRMSDLGEPPHPYRSGQKYAGDHSNTRSQTCTPFQPSKPSGSLTSFPGPVNSKPQSLSGSHHLQSASQQIMQNSCLGSKNGK